MSGPSSAQTPSNRPGRRLLAVAFGTDHFVAPYAHARKVTDVAFKGIDPAELNTALTVVPATKERAAAALR